MAFWSKLGNRLAVLIAVGFITAVALIVLNEGVGNLTGTPSTTAAPTAPAPMQSKRFGG